MSIKTEINESESLITLFVFLVHYESLMNEDIFPQINLFELQ
jgi:hypothetical protein